MVLLLMLQFHKELGECFFEQIVPELRVCCEWSLIAKFFSQWAEGVSVRRTSLPLAIWY